MKKVFLVLFTVAFIFSFDVRALADEGHSHDTKDHESTNQEGMEHEDMEMHSESEHEDMEMNSESGHEDMDMNGGSGHEDMDMNGESGHEDMDMNGESEHEDVDMNGDSEHEDVDATSENEHEGGHHGPVIETPPNYKVLGTFGGVNLAFIIIGVWNKWFRRKGDLNNGNA